MTCKKKIELKDISKHFDNQIIFENVNFTVNEGDVVSIIGPSGTGKSTLLYCINMLSAPTSGQILLNGEDLASPDCDLNAMRRRVGMVFQQFNLFGHLTVLENVMKPQIDLLKRSKQEACDKAMEYLRLVGMADKKFHYPDRLSGGQKQRVAIARTLAMDPEVILLDEPTSALDPTMTGEVEYVIKKLAKQGCTMLIVTHKLRFAKEISNRVIYMDENGIYEEGPTEQIFFNPQKENTRRFIQRLKCLDLELVAPDADYIGAICDIEQYGEKLSFSPERIRRVNLLFEELCIQSLLPALPRDSVVKVAFEYNEKTDRLGMKVSHPGEKLMDTIYKDEISRKLVEHLANEIDIEEVIEE